MTTQTRRRFLSTLSLAGVAMLARLGEAEGAEGPPETTTVRFTKSTNICVAPQYVAEELLHAEGFTDVRYVDLPRPAAVAEAVAGGTADFGMIYCPPFIAAIDAGRRFKMLAGVHVGCFELFANRAIHGIADLKGKRFAMAGLQGPAQLLMSAMAAYVGLDPANDIEWVVSQAPRPIELFKDGKVDAVIAFAPEPQLLRAQNFGNVIVNSAIDRPWAQYFCCILGGNPEYVADRPVATKRVLRAILTAADLCAAEPVRATRRLVDGGFTARYDYALQAVREIPYGTWRDYDAEDTIRFYALRLHEAGLIKSSPQKIIAEGTDWRFLDELKRELKA
jgi:NitT/TauT family transport system substrate-binding protein